MKKIKIVLLLVILILNIGCKNNDVKEVNSGQLQEVSLKVKREKSMGGLLIDYDVYIDDKKIGQISNNDAKEYKINMSQGEHEIYIKKWIKSNKIKFNVNEDISEIKFTCKTKSTFGIKLWNDFEID